MYTLYVQYSLEWDENKKQSNYSKHGLNFEDASLVFQNHLETITLIDRRKNYGEERYITFGKLDGELIVLVHTFRENAIRIISMRKANEREKESYYKKRHEADQEYDGRRH
ncbi:MAG: BrnT family toxin [Gammaproteobacteria bacterium]